MADADQIMSDLEEQMMMEVMDRLEKSMNEMNEKHGRDLSEMKEMLQSLIDYASPSTYQKQSVGSIPSSSEQITRSSPSADAQMVLKLVEPISDMKKLKNQMREESPKELKNQIEETQVFEGVVNQDEGLKQIEMSRTPILAKETLNPIAHQVLEEMPRGNASARTYDCDELLNFDPGGEVLCSQMRRSSVLTDTQMDVNLEELDQIEINEDPIVAKKHLDLGAHEVLDEMPRLMEKEIELVDAYPTEFEVLLNETPEQESPPLTSEEKDGSNSKVFEVCKAETGVLDELEMISVHVRTLCFDPGGRALK